MLFALFFLPTNDVINGFVKLHPEIRNNFNTDADNLLKYFEDMYIVRFRQSVPCRDPSFSINLWNIFNKTEQILPIINRR